MKNILQILLFVPIIAMQVFSQGHWSQRFAQVGTNNNVPQALAVGSDGTVYIGGGFDYAFGVKTNYFAKWNPQTGWDSIPGKFYGSSFPISSIAAGNGSDIYAAGGFSGVGNLAGKGIVKWNGSQWDSVPGAYTLNTPSKIVYANGTLYALGSFSKAGNVAVHGIARWNSAQWDSMGSLRYANSNGSASNKAFTITTDGRIYAATYSIDTFNKENVAIVKWNGTTWDTVATGLTGSAVTASGSSTKAHVNDIAVYGDTIYVVGAFSQAGDKMCNCIAKWNGISWDSLGEGIGTELLNVAVDSIGRVYAAGSRSPAKINNVTDAIGRWNGQKWERLGAGITKSQYGQLPKVSEMKLVGSKVFLCGDFSTPGGLAETGAAMYDIANSTWKSLNGKNTNGFSDGLVNSVYESPSGEFYVGGNFLHAGSMAYHGIARWNGSSWDSVGSGGGIDAGAVKIISADDTVMYFGGTFTKINGTPSSGIAKFNGNKFTTLTSAFGQPGLSNGDIRTMARYNGSMVMGGSFTGGFGSFPNARSVYSIIRWNGTSWDSLDIGITIRAYISNFEIINPGTVDAIAVNGNDLFVGGSFTHAGSDSIANFARWDGTKWNRVGGDIRLFGQSGNAEVRAIAVFGNDIYIAGKFDSIGTMACSNIAKWNGTKWDTVSNAMKTDYSGITDMALDKDGRIYVVGDFSPLYGDNTKKYAVRWNGSEWESLGSGITSSYSIQMQSAKSDSKGNIWISGYFGYTDGFSSQNFARWINDAGAIDAVKKIESTVMPKEFILEQNYPNPFNPSTSISFRIASFSDVSLKIYDVIGREVATLVNNKMSSGKYEIRFDASKLSSGIYFYLLKAGVTIQTKKMILLK